MNEHSTLRFTLFTMRLTVFIVMLFWTIDKFVRPEHAAGVFAHFYNLSFSNHMVFLAIGIVELLVLFAFLTGLFKRISYGIVFLMHAVSTLSSYHQYLHPFTGVNLLFFAAWPMLAACLTLYLLREKDTLFTIRTH